MQYFWRAGLSGCFVHAACLIITISTAWLLDLMFATAIATGRCGCRLKDLAAQRGIEVDWSSVRDEETAKASLLSACTADNTSRTSAQPVSYILPPGRHRWLLCTVQTTVIARTALALQACLTPARQCGGTVIPAKPFFARWPVIV